MNFLSRGTYWRAEERAQLGTSIGNGDFMPGDSTDGTGIKNRRYRNDCGVGNLPNEGTSGEEDCSLDMISSVASAYWIRIDIDSFSGSYPAGLALGAWPSSTEPRDTG